LNKRFFNKDFLTDVISFRLEKDYAEVFIAPCAVKKNAVIFKSGFSEEIYRCVVHGILHVQGYKDYTKKDKDKMWKRQESILENILDKNDL
jgi:rRNA maturation RNase YbeY